ncbi:MAG TPA: hypothetical protein VKG22_04520 [Stellaceae bacterium]|nr:hypothetical protein [Stellaceae bacterium]HMD65897.1 hypothetical protein [Stellaceae bacterium]
MRSLGPRNLFYAPEFVRLRHFCATQYPGAGSKSEDFLGIALGHALEALGLPCSLPSEHYGLALPANLAAIQLHQALQRTDAARVCLCPLDSADDLPDLAFGPNRIARLTAAELQKLVDPPRLKRVNPTWTFDADRFSKFTWLVIQKIYPLDRTPAERAIPLLFEPIGRDWGAIEPHRQRVPPAAEKALFTILLAPWEDWVKDPEWSWRGFDVPWVYQLDDDIFVRPPPPPSPDTLAWGDESEGVFGAEHPKRTPLHEADRVAVSDWLNDVRWSNVTQALERPLFETPIAHFFVKAFLAEHPLDEFLAHITTIEAALGLETDYNQRGATKRVAARVSALLGSEDCGRDYCRLFNIRSKFLHGRPMGAIPSQDRIAARRLARQVQNSLVKAALGPPWPQSRKDYLHGLAR